MQRVFVISNSGRIGEKVVRLTPDGHSSADFGRQRNARNFYGMPAFGGKLSNDQVWQLVAYVRSLSGLVRQDAASGRSDHMQVKKPEIETDREIPTSTKAEHP